MKKLFKLLEKKHNFILEKTGIEYLTQEDWDELKSWDEHDLELIYHRIKNASTDSSSCPWCIKTGSLCSICGYGDRHGECHSYWYNDYDLIIDELGSSIQEAMRNEND